MTWKSVVELTFVTSAVLVDTSGVMVQTFSNQREIFQKWNLKYPTDPTLTTSKGFPEPYGISYSVKKHFKR